MKTDASAAMWFVVNPIASHLCCKSQKEHLPSEMIELIERVDIGSAIPEI